MSENNVMQVPNEDIFDPFSRPKMSFKEHGPESNIHLKSDAQVPTAPSHDKTYLREIQTMLNAESGDKPLNPKDFGVKEEDVVKDKSFSTNGGVGVEARDVNADVNATIGVDKVDKSVTVGDNSTLTINNDNSKTVNKNRFDRGVAMGDNVAQPSQQASADLSK